MLVFGSVVKLFPWDFWVAYFGTGTLGPNHSNKKPAQDLGLCQPQWLVSVSLVYHEMFSSPFATPSVKKNRCNKASLHFSGYARGEGVGAAFLSFAESTELARAELCGAAANQDGRSASLTAPNGPSQQAVIRRA